MKHSYKAAALLAATLAFLAPSAQAEEAHEHGHAELMLVIEGSGGELEIEIPAIDVVGFERAPASDAENAAVADALAILGDFDGLFMLTAAAGCSAVEAEAEFEIEGDHAAFHAHYELACAQGSAVTSLKTTAFDAFPSLEEIDAAVVTESSQAGGEMEADSPSLSF
jgi:hypothetical protein